MLWFCVPTCLFGVDKYHRIWYTMLDKILEKEREDI